MKKTIIASLALLLAGPALADWQLDNDNSRLSFVSVKKNTIGEAHRFTQLRGNLKDNGKLSVVIPLTSVDTQIPIRNERMQKLLFETDLFPSAELNATVDPKHFQLPIGSSKIITVEADLGLHGVNKIIMTEVMITRITDKKMLVSSVKPILISAADFGLDKGLMKLQAVAKLPGITHSVPVSFVLTFNQ